jgi:acyl-coenzyme A thioesterase PaaI-like protein
MQKQPNSAMCFVCGRDNPIGLHIHFFMDEQNQVHADLTPQAEHQGFPGVMHGGLISTLFDETIGRAAIAHNIWCMTAELKVRFKKPVRIDEPLHVMGELVDINKRVLRGRGELRRAADNTLLAEAEAVYIRLPDEQRAQMESALLDWRVDE